MTSASLTQPRCVRCDVPVRTLIWDEGGKLEGFCHGEREVVLLEPGQIGRAHV